MAFDSTGVPSFMMNNNTSNGNSKTEFITPWEAGRRRNAEREALMIAKMKEERAKEAQMIEDAKNLSNKYKTMQEYNSEGTGRTLQSKLPVINVNGQDMAYDKNTGLYWHGNDSFTQSQIESVSKALNNQQIANNSSVPIVATNRNRVVQTKSIPVVDNAPVVQQQIQQPVQQQIPIPEQSSQPSSFFGGLFHLTDGQRQQQQAAHDAIVNGWLGGTKF